MNLDFDTIEIPEEKLNDMMKVMNPVIGFATHGIRNGSIPSASITEAMTYGNFLRTAMASCLSWRSTSSKDTISRKETP